MNLNVFGSAGNWSASGEYEDGVDPPLLACPFCGESTNLDCANTHTPWYSVQCYGCGCEGPASTVGRGLKRGASKTATEAIHRLAAQQAIDLWNARYYQRRGRAP